MCNTHGSCTSLLPRSLVSSRRTVLRCAELASHSPHAPFSTRCTRAPRLAPATGAQAAGSAPLLRALLCLAAPLTPVRIARTSSLVADAGRRRAVLAAAAAVRATRRCGFRCACASTWELPAPAAAEAERA